MFTTGVARFFDWEGSKVEKFCDVILVTLFGDIVMNCDEVTEMTS